ncbi:Glutamate 5-kinase / RNA-binding C-terminal domain PUA [hydrothermal vent metagenome]|uniref:Glutamate 5-kinase / RNA-binding C-terminal domain PUA n=1 Tax=hydrothermal vent metagenome TaxID=652676 RepID=A0A3B0VUF3_9ZZZZ
MRRRAIKDAKRVVVKVGSSVLVDGAGVRAAPSCDCGAPGLCAEVFTRLATEVCDARSNGFEIVLVSSGSIAMGLKKLGLERRPVTIPERQAIAAVGQVDLMTEYDRGFHGCGAEVAQVLLTHADLSDRRRFLNARNTISELLRRGIVPIINENDTVAVDEIKFGDNDNLSALVANLASADLLIMLSDIDGIFDKDPKLDKDARRISIVEDIDGLNIPAHGSSGGFSGASMSFYGTGGITTKVESARKAAHFGCATVIANGKLAGVLERVLACEDIGTLILPQSDKLTSKKHWIAYSTRPSGKVFVDAGARSALVDKGRSLLPSGITAVTGSFEAGEAVLCVDEKGTEFARGVVNYGSVEIEKLKGKKSGQIEEALGYKVYDEVIHRDNLVVL